MSNLPSLYNSEDAFRDYVPRTQEFMDVGAKAGLRPAAEDKSRGALVVIDMQNDFVRPDGALSVPGAEADLQRLVEFIYNNAEQISAIYCTLDTHYPMQIFYSEWWHNPASGEPPAAFTVITAEDVAGGVWVARQDAEWSQHYVTQLAQQGHKQLMIWPKHTMLGTWGQALSPALYEAIAWHSAARLAQPVFVAKGDLPQVERYGAFAPEVEYPDDPRGRADRALLDELAGYARTWWAGEAETHCVIASQVQAAEYYAKQPKVLEGMHFLTDCTSPILHPEVDFVGPTRAEQQRLAGLGVKLVKSTD